MVHVTFDIARSPRDLEDILRLQQENVETALTEDEVRQDGFVTVRHDLPLLSAMNEAEPQIIARHEGRVGAYALVMPRSFEGQISVLQPMYEQIRPLKYHDRPVEAHRFFYMGQVCVSKVLRGQGVFQGLYRHMAEHYQTRFDFVVTEVATRNGRSLRAHEKVGFELLLRYEDPNQESWDIIVWNWK